MGLRKKMAEWDRKQKELADRLEKKADKMDAKIDAKQAERKEKHEAKRKERKQHYKETSNERWLGIGKMFAGATIFYYAAVPLAVLFVILLFVGVGLWDFIVGLF